MHGDISYGAFTLLEDDCLRFQPFERLNERTVTLLLPTTDDDTLPAVLPYSSREHRPLVVLDADIPENGFSRKSRQLHQQFLGLRLTNPHEMRKTRDHELPVQRLPARFRRFLILPSGSGVFIQYRSRSRAFKYVVLDLHREEGSRWCLTTKSLSF